MATDKDERKSPSVDDLSDLSSVLSSDGESDTEEPQQVEWLVTSRAKRSTAGNRMKSMLANEEPAAEDSDLELLFAEDEDDAGFTDDQQDASDVQMDSSSDEEDKEDNADELEGEKDLERQAREKRAAERKRKAQDAIPAKFRKKVRIEQPAARPPRPKKKSERTSWLPSPADMPTRASERSTTRISKQQLHQKMVSDELRRRKQLERMEKKAKQLEAMKKPPMTQAERLAEAAIVERRNAKSLNRWEEAEKQREEERLRKIAALHSRKLDGPVVTFWSGIQELQEGQGKHVGNLVSMEEKAPRKKRQSAAAALAAKEAEAEASTPTTPTKAHPTSAKPVNTPQEAPPSASEPPREGKVTRSCIILQNFDDHAIKDKQVQTQILFGRKMNKLAKPGHPALCVITHQPAKYRDPKTGLPYHNSYAYREIQRVYRGDYKWSSLIGAWVGRGDYAARGVPEWFLDPSKARKPAERVSGPVDDGGAVEPKKEEKEEKPGDEPRLEPVEGTEAVEGVKGAEAAPPAAPQVANA
ncbi:hypothetical protein NEMBOFW57_000396 [Staphylotrichum longicolle]|uniref:Vps72/YL1 C-terminal domain-containing protein n=1 Tax=Staphylotrichum longicolle TaxID=669026 RepID=A0AAD4EZA5_9PEZI|nr:hypothetical protein NEMBOFW57_000396 [Staphylotrichum longicolle]